MSGDEGSRRELTTQRWEVLRQVEEWLETPMIVLGFAWLALLILELTRGLGRSLEIASNTIWVVFILDFALRFLLAPEKLRYLRSNWITALALALPAVRVLRAVRILRAVRGIRLIRIVTSLNRGMLSLGRTMRRRHLGYVIALTAIVALAGAAGMLAFERRAGEVGIQNYAEALWWTMMLLTTIGSDYWPVTPEGRMLTLLLSAYALGVLGYLTAALASFFLGVDAGRPDGEVAGEATLREIQVEIAALRAEVRGVADRIPPPPPPTVGAGPQR